MVSVGDGVKVSELVLPNKLGDEIVVVGSRNNRPPSSISILKRNGRGRLLLQRLEPSE
jgi:hypothetical protein